jgi:hypothetical protein
MYSYTTVLLDVDCLGRNQRPLMCRSRDREKNTPTDIIIRTEHWKETTAEKYKRGKLFWFLLGECRESERERRVRQAFDVIIAGLVKAADNHGREEGEEEEP